MKKNFYLIIIFIGIICLPINKAKARTFMYLECPKCDISGCKDINRYYMSSVSFADAPEMFGISGNGCSASQGNKSYQFDKNNCWIEKIEKIKNTCDTKKSITDNITIKMSREGVCPAGVRFRKNPENIIDVHYLLPAGTNQPIKSSYIDNGEYIFYKYTPTNSSEEKIVAEAYGKDGKYASINSVAWEGSTTQRCIINSGAGENYFKVATNFNALFVRNTYCKKSNSDISFLSDDECKKDTKFEEIMSRSDGGENIRLKNAISDWYSTEGKNADESVKSIEAISKKTNLIKTSEEIKKSVKLNKKYTFTSSYSENDLAKDLNETYELLKKSYDYKFQLYGTETSNEKTSDPTASAFSYANKTIFGVNDFSEIGSGQNVDLIRGLVFEDVSKYIIELSGTSDINILDIGETLDGYLLEFLTATKYLAENNSGDVTVVNITDLAEKYQNLGKEHNIQVVLSCKDLLGEELIKKINSYLNIVKIVIPILLIGFGISDFIKATFSNDEEAMKKAQKTFATRLIIAILIFLVPIFVNLILNLANSVWASISPNSCGIFD